MADLTGRRATYRVAAGPLYKLPLGVIMLPPWIHLGLRLADGFTFAAAGRMTTGERI